MATTYHVVYVIEKNELFSGKHEKMPDVRRILNENWMAGSHISGVAEIVEKMGSSPYFAWNSQIYRVEGEGDKLAAVNTGWLFKRLE